MEEKPKLLSERLAEYDVKIWQAHHRKDKMSLLKNLTMKISLEHGLSREEAVEIAEYWISAAEYHDKAERCEDTDNLTEAERYWQLAKKSLVDCYALLSIKKSFV